MFPCGRLRHYGLNTDLVKRCRHLTYFLRPAPPVQDDPAKLARAVVICSDRALEQERFVPLAM